MGINFNADASSKLRYFALRTLYTLSDDGEPVRNGAR
jgi:hypothetical protein